MTNETVYISDLFNEWADALQAVGDEGTEQTGDSIPALTAMIGKAYVAVNNGTIREVLPAEEVEEAEMFLVAYDHVVDPMIAGLMSTGWIEPLVCEGCDCGAIVPVPSMPVCNCCAEASQ